MGINDIMKEAWNTASTATADTDRKDKLQPLSLAKECYAMRLDLLSSATVVERAVQFVERNRGGLTETQQNDKIRIDHTADTIAAGKLLMTLQNLNKLLDKYDRQAR